MNGQTNLNNNPTCKSCGSTRVRKYGKYKGVQRYYCNECGARFKNDDTLFHMKTPAYQVSSALNMYYTIPMPPSSQSEATSGISPFVHHG